MKNWMLHLSARRRAAFTPLQLPPASLASHPKALSTMKRHQCRAPLMLLLLSLCWLVRAADLPSLCADRAAIERVYYNHRLGEKPPFDQALPPATLENLVRQDLRKEAALKKFYGVEVTPSLLDAEVRRINTSTRAPDMLAEIKAALGNDPARFANRFAKPIVVERLLREKISNDDTLHAPQRHEMEGLREELLRTRSSRGNEALTEKSAIGNRQSAIDPSLLTSAATKDLVAQFVTILRRNHANAVTETTWQLTARPAETNAPAAEEIEMKKQFGAQAQILSAAPAATNEIKFYFAELPGELQNVLRVQLRQPGDVSAVIETPSGFLLYVAKEKTDVVLSVAAVFRPKCSYEQWLAEHSQE